VNQHAVPNATLGLPGKPINGGSKPRFYDFDDGVTRLVKWHPSPHGAKACYNELVASRLGQLISAPILRGAVVYVPDDIIPADHRADGAMAGFHFAMTMMEGENFVPAQHYSEIQNSSELPMAAVHLAWLAVGDQQGHNQYFQRLELRRPGASAVTTKYFRLIDMGQMFGSCNWDAASVQNVHTSYKLPPHLAAMLKRDSLLAAIADLNGVDETAIRDCFADCPDTWGVPEADRLAGATRAITARRTISDIIRAGNSGIL
jgi:hypothetical protein